VFVKTPIVIGGKLRGPYPARITLHVNQQLNNHGAHRQAKHPANGHPKGKEK